MQLEQIKELIEALNQSDLTTLKIKDGDFKISLSKNASNVVTMTSPNMPTPTTAPAIAPSLPNTPVLTATTSTPTALGETVDSPMIGTFYEASSPQSPAFVKVGDTIKKGSVIGIIEAMKIMNEIEAEFDFKVLEVLVKNEQPVEFDMPLFKVEKL